MPLPDENRITYFAYTDARNKRVQFGIKAKDRTRHVYVIGKTGMGKSTLLENMAIQDIQNGEGFAFIDPHGKTADYLLDFIPEHRIKDVLYFAPFDTANPIAFNIMEDVGADKRHLVVAGLMSAFKKIWVDAWSARMEYILQNTLLALLEYPGATLLAVNKMLSDKDYRKKVVEHITDPTVRSFWVDEFAKYTDKFAAEATPAIQNKVGQFTSNPLIRNIIGQSKSSFDLRKAMDEKKIIIINLSKGLVGEGNANLLGSMLITKIYLAAMSRADVSEREMARLPNFYLYVDEFQSFANESFANILSEARKYKLNLTIAHQYIEQMSEEVRAAVFGNVGTMVVYRVGPFDAEVFEKEFIPTFTAEDFVNLGMYQMYLKLMIDGVGSQPFSAIGMPPIQKPILTFKEKVVENSQHQFGRLRATVESQIAEQFAQVTNIPNQQPRAERPSFGGSHNNDSHQKYNGHRSDGHSSNHSNSYSNNHSNSHNSSFSKHDSTHTPKRYEGDSDKKKIDDWGKKKEDEGKKEVGSDNHLQALRKTLAAVIGENDISGPKPKEEIREEKRGEKSEPVKFEQRNNAQSAPTSNQPKTENKISEEKKDTVDDSLNSAPKKNNTSEKNRAALAAVLAELKAREVENTDTEEDEEQKKPIEKETVAPQSLHKKEPKTPREVSEKDLREMLRVHKSDTQ